MRLVLAYEAHFYAGIEGIYTDSVYPYSYWRRFLRVFDDVVVAARVSTVPPPANAVRSDGPRVTFWPMPFYRGPRQLVATFPRLLHEANRLLDRYSDAAFILRVPGVIGTLLWQGLIRRRLHYGVQIVGDPMRSLRDVSVLGGLLPRPAAALLRHQARQASAATYVTRAELQRRYPTTPGRPLFAVSDVELPDTLFETPIQAADNKRISIVFVGALSQRYKGLDVLLRALTLTPSVQRLTVVGDGTRRAELAQLAQDLGIANQVEFVGAIPSGDPVLEVIRRHDLFVLPSRTEGLPRAMLEAMALGTPCLGTRVGGIPELLEEEDLVPVEDVLALAKQIEAMATDPARRHRAAERNRLIAWDYRASARDVTLQAFYESVRDASTSRTS